MAVCVAAIASGSNGNCYYVSDGQTAVLIDLGISCRELDKRLLALKISPASIAAVFISHEHNDHICGLEAATRKHGWPVFINEATLANSRLQLNPSLVRHFTPGETVVINQLSIHTFTKRHDAAQPCSFVVEAADGQCVGVLTDIGLPCATVLAQFARCQAVFLESNYCEKMLWEGRYPAHLKRRIHGSYGHLSNDQALQLFVQHRHPQLRLLVLSHLSQHNNRPELVAATFAPLAGNTHVVVASRYEPTPLLHLNGPPPVRMPRLQQASLFS